MKKVITYGTFDLLHQGHVRLLKRARALGDYLIVGVTSDDYDRSRGKFNAAQSLMERIDAVKKLGIADEIVVEEYDGQKIEDIRRFGVDVFTVGSDWIGAFDYLKKYCKVVYLPRTEGISSSQLRAGNGSLRVGIVGKGKVADKYRREIEFVNGLTYVGSAETVDSYRRLLKKCDAVYLQTHPRQHLRDIVLALKAGKHVLCESPIALDSADCRRLFKMADEKGLVLMDAIKTAYSTAYNRMLLLLQTGKIGKVVSVDATCSSLMSPCRSAKELHNLWNSREAWAPSALMTVFQILGTSFVSCSRTSFFAPGSKTFDVFSKFDFRFSDAVATVKVAKGVKSEGELVVSGTKGYLYVPAPWWKMDYFETRFEDQEENRKYFYQLDGEGIRLTLAAFRRAVVKGLQPKISREISELICKGVSSL